MSKPIDHIEKQYDALVQLLNNYRHHLDRSASDAKLPYFFSTFQTYLGQENTYSTNVQMPNDFSASLKGAIQALGHDSETLAVELAKRCFEEDKDAGIKAPDNFDGLKEEFKTTIITPNEPAYLVSRYIEKRDELQKKYQINNTDPISITLDKQLSYLIELNHYLISLTQTLSKRTDLDAESHALIQAHKEKYEQGLHLINRYDCFLRDYITRQVINDAMENATRSATTTTKINAPTGGGEEEQTPREKTSPLDKQAYIDSIRNTFLTNDQTPSRELNIIAKGDWSIEKKAFLVALGTVLGFGIGGLIVAAKLAYDSYKRTGSINFFRSAEGHIAAAVKEAPSPKGAKPR